MNLKIRNWLLNGMIAFAIVGVGMGAGTLNYKAGYRDGFDKGHATRSKPSGVTVQVHWFTPKGALMEVIYPAGETKFRRTVDTFGVNGYALGTIKSFWEDGEGDTKVVHSSTLPQMEIADTAHNKY